MGTHESVPGWCVFENKTESFRGLKNKPQRVSLESSHYLCCCLWFFSEGKIVSPSAGSNNVCWRMKWKSHPFLSTHKGKWLIMGPLLFPPTPVLEHRAWEKNEPQIKLRWNFTLFPFETFSTSLWKPSWDLSCFYSLHTLVRLLFSLDSSQKGKQQSIENNNLTRSIFDIVIWTADYNGLSVLKRK